jgi:hypothetical protein
MEKRLRRKEERERMGTGTLVDSQTGVLAKYEYMGLI